MVFLATGSSGALVTTPNEWSLPPRPGRFHRYLCRLEPRLTDLHFDPSDPFFRLVVRAHDLMHSLSTKTTP